MPRAASAVRGIFLAEIYNIVLVYIGVLSYTSCRGKEEPMEDVRMELLVTMAGVVFAKALDVATDIVIDIIRKRRNEKAPTRHGKHERRP